MTHQWRQHNTCPVAHAAQQRSSLRSRTARLRSHGFTIIELLVAVGLVIVLLAILAVAVSGATRTAQISRTSSLMSAMKHALIRFHGDIGYYPPVLGVDGNRLRDLFDPPNPASSNYRDEIQEWWSSCALADYLIGYGAGVEDGYGYPSQNEIPPLGIRNPGDDGVWGAVRNPTGTSGPLGSLGRRNPPIEGKVFGPYLELKDTRVLAAVAYVNGELQTFFPGEQLPGGQTWETMPKAIVDYWGMPIRYYRRPYPPGALKQSYRSVWNSTTGTSSEVPTLSDVFVLRPWTIKETSESNVLRTRFFDDAGNTTTTHQLNAAEFAMLSTGPDKTLDQRVTVDENEFNKDNIVELGP